MKIQVAVVFGGKSVEHEISVVSALQALSAANSQKYDIVPVYISKEGEWYSGDILLKVDNYKNTASLLKQAVRVFPLADGREPGLYTKGTFGALKLFAKIDVVLPVLHGTYGEDGAFQGLMELMAVPYAGCNVLSSAVGMDKILMKKILRESGIPVVDYTWFTSREWFSKQAEVIASVESLSYPVIVKPANLGSSVGISKAANRDELINALDMACRFSQRIIVEKMVTELREINCSVLGDAESALPSVCEEPVRSGELLSYSDKYLSGGGSKGGAKGGGSKGMSSTKRLIPAPISEVQSDEIQKYALATFRELGCAGVSRIDFLVDAATDKVYVNEINTIPGSLSFYLWEATGIKFDELVDRLIDLAFKQKRENDGLVHTYSENIFSFSGSSSKLGKS